MFEDGVVHAATVVFDSEFDVLGGIGDFKFNSPPFIGGFEGVRGEVQDDLFHLGSGGLDDGWSVMVEDDLAVGEFVEVFDHAYDFIDDECEVYRLFFGRL